MDSVDDIHSFRRVCRHGAVNELRMESNVVGDVKSGIFFRFNFTERLCSLCLSEMAMGGVIGWR